jgi:hypothetical protein
VIAGGVAGLGAGLLFATIHAIVIVPIWGRMTQGLVFGVLAGMAAGWAFAELKVEHTPAHSRLRDGVTFGVLLWLAVVPVTLANAFLRHTGFAKTHEAITDTIAVILAVLGGSVLGWVLSHRRRGAAAGAAGVLMLTAAMGGPVPVARSVRAVEILFAVLAASVLGGIILAFLEPLFRDKNGPPDGAGNAPRTS